jgi:hypothetical protein
MCGVVELDAGSAAFASNRYPFAAFAVEYLHVSAVVAKTHSETDVAD